MQVDRIRNVTPKTRMVNYLFCYHGSHLENRVMKFAAIAAIAFTAHAAVQRPERLVDLDFEEGLHGWNRTGSAFASQPVNGEGFSTTRARVVRLGGDYWRDLRYPVGYQG